MRLPRDVSGDDLAKALARSFAALRETWRRIAAPERMRPSHRNPLDLALGIVCRGLGAGGARRLNQELMARLYYRLAGYL